MAHWWEKWSVSATRLKSNAFLTAAGLGMPGLIDAWQRGHWMCLRLRLATSALAPARAKLVPAGQVGCDLDGDDAQCLRRNSGTKGIIATFVFVLEHRRLVSVTGFTIYLAGRGQGSSI